MAALGMGLMAIACRAPARSPEGEPSSGTSAEAGAELAPAPGASGAAILPGGAPAAPPAPGGVVPCGGERVVVIVRASALASGAEPAAVEAELRTLSERLLRPLAARVRGPVEPSPAIRAFRVAAVDSAAAVALMAALRERPEVEFAGSDDCGVRADGGR